MKKIIKIAIINIASNSIEQHLALALNEKKVNPDNIISVTQSTTGEYGAMVVVLWWELDPKTTSL